MANKQLRDFLNQLPPEMRNRIASATNAEAAAKNAEAVAEIFDAASDAVLNVGVIGMANAFDDEERALIQRSTAFPITVLKTLEQFVMRMLPDGPKQGAHDMIKRTVDGMLPTFDKLMPELLPQGVKARAEVLAKRGQTVNPLGADDPPPPEGASIGEDVGGVTNG